MSLAEHFRNLARYNTWMNRSLYELAGGLSDEERRRDLGAFFGSIHGTLNHLLLADRAWLGRFVGDRERHASRDADGNVIEIRSLGQELYAGFADLRRERERTDADIEAWAASLDDAALEAPLRYRSMAGEPQEHPLFWAVAHFFNHQTHHRGQATTLFKQLGKDPGVTDLIALLRTEAAALRGA